VFGLADDGSQIPLRFGFVVRNNRSAATTDNEGQFSVSVDPDVDRLVLTFIDNNNKLMTTTKASVTCADWAINLSLQRTRAYRLETCPVRMLRLD